MLWAMCFHPHDSPEGQTHWLHFTDVEAEAREDETLTGGPRAGKENSQDLNPGSQQTTGSSNPFLFLLLEAKPNLSDFHRYYLLICSFCALA